MQVPELLAGYVAAQNARSIDVMLRYDFMLDRGRIARLEIDG